MNKIILICMCMILMGQKEEKLFINDIEVKSNVTQCCKEGEMKNAKLYINNKEVIEDGDIKIHCSGAYMPLFDITEQLGFGVEWDAEKFIAKLSYEGKEYIFEPKKGTLIDVEKNNNILLMPPGGVYFYCDIIDGEIIVNDNIMRYICGLVNMQIRIDYDNLVININ